MKKKTDFLSTFLVDYEAGDSLIHEFMDVDTYLKLLEKEEYGEIKILNHVDIVSGLKA